MGGPEGRQPTQDEYWHYMTAWWAGTTAEHLRADHEVEPDSEDPAELVHQHIGLHGLNPATKPPTLDWARQAATKMAKRQASTSESRPDPQ